MRVLSIQVFFRILSERQISLDSCQIRQRTSMVWRDAEGEYVLEWRDGRIYPCIYTSREISA